MSTGNKRGSAKSPAELYQMLGQGDTNELYAKSYRLDTDHDIPYGGGNSVDGKAVYIDRTLYREVMDPDGPCKVRGMTGRQIVHAWVEHEHTEWAVDAGDNPVDVYMGAHGFAEAKERRFVQQLGVNPERYEALIGPCLKRCEARDPENPPKDLWCGPYLDEPTPRDKELLRIFKAKGVVDAFKASKIDADYGVGQAECKDCRYFGGGKIAPCEKVCGLVRWNRRCDWFSPKKGSK